MQNGRDSFGFGCGYWCWRITAVVRLVAHVVPKNELCVLIYIIKITRGINIEKHSDTILVARGFINGLKQMIFLKGMMYFVLIVTQFGHERGNINLS